MSALRPSDARANHDAAVGTMLPLAPVSARSGAAIFGTALTAQVQRLLLLLAPAVVRNRLRLVWNVSASVPVGLYRHRARARAALRVGELVALRPSPVLASLHGVSPLRRSRRAAGEAGGSGGGPAGLPHRTRPSRSTSVTVATALAPPTAWGGCCRSGRAAAVCRRGDGVPARTCRPGVI